MYFLTAVLPLATVFMAPLFVSYFDGPRSLFVVLTVLATGVAGAAALCAFRVSASVTDEEVLVINGPKEHRVSLDDVATVTAGWVYPVATLVTSSGERVRVLALPQTMFPDRRTADFLGLLHSRGVRLDDEIERLSRWNGDRLKAMCQQGRTMEGR